MLRRPQSGFMLLELLFTLSITAILLLATLRITQMGIKHYLTSYRSVRLEQSVERVLQVMEKELKRAGFLVPRLLNQLNSVSSAIQFQEEPQKRIKSCLTVRYDLNVNGVIERDESFAYRLKEGVIEHKKGVIYCGGAYWENITDPNEIVIERLELQQQKQSAQTLLTLSVTAYWKGFPHTVHIFHRTLRNENIS